MISSAMQTISPGTNNVQNIIAIMDRVYQQIEAEGVLYTAFAVMIYKHFVLDDMPILATLRFG